MPYAFWRNHNTRLAGAGKTDSAPAAVLQALGESASVNADGSISWQLHQAFEDFQTTISSSIAIVEPDGQELNETDSIFLISRAVNKVIQRHKGGKGIRPKELIDQVEKNAAEFFTGDPVHRIFVSSISAAPEIMLPPKILGLHVRMCNRRDFPYSPILCDEVTQDQNFVYKHITSSRYLTLGIETHCITVAQAYHKGTAALSCFLAIINLIKTYRQKILFSWSDVPTRKWIVVIQSSPIATLHAEDGSPIGTTYQYEPSYTQDAPLFNSSDGLHSTLSRATEYLNLLENSPLKQDLTNFLDKYNHALCNSDYRVVYLHLWALLESITCTTGLNYDDTINRAIWLFTDNTQALKNTLQSARTMRNRLVHSNASTESLFQYCLIVKEIVDIHLVNLLRAGNKIASLDEYAALLATPKNVDVLQQRISSLKKSLDFRLHSVVNDYTI